MIIALGDPFATQTAAGRRQIINNRSIEFERGKVACTTKGLTLLHPKLPNLPKPARGAGVRFLASKALTTATLLACSKAGKFKWQGFCKATCKSQEQKKLMVGWVVGYLDGQDSYRESGVSSVNTRAAKGKGEEKHAWIRHSYPCP